MLDTLKTCQMVVHNRALQYSMLGVKEGVEQGLSLTEAFERTGQFSGLVVRMVRVGEETGRLDHAFETVNRFYDQDVEEMVDSLLETLQPALTILMGSLLLWVVVAVFGPLYQSITSMQRF
jgi:type IV pilus assembly protein PilC